MQTELIARAAQMGVPVSDGQAEKFRAFHALLTEANARMNLTRVPDELSEAIDRNYLDSIAPLAFGLIADGAAVADVGSGAGFPGIPLSILRPDARFTLLDSLGKRVEFLSDAAMRLGLNASARALRAEDAGRDPALRACFDVATARAVAALNVLAEFCLPLLKIGGRMIAYKGPAWEAELLGAEAALAALGGAFRSAHKVEIPGRDWAHALIVLEKVADTPEKYPRRAGIPEKRPL